MKQLLDNNGKPTGLWAVEVPEEANYVKDTYADGIMWQINGHYDSFYFENELKAPYDILGECTKESISFDVIPFLDKHLKHEGIQVYKTCGGIINGTDIPNEAFYSLLEHNGLFWENPYGEKPNIFSGDYDGDPYDDMEMCDKETYKEDLERWQQAENSRIKGKLIILKQIIL